MSASQGLDNHVKRVGQPFQSPSSFSPDPLIAPLLHALWQSQIETRGSCHGHLRNGRFSSPYVSVAASRRSIAWVGLACRIQPFLILRWTALGCEYRGQKWISLTVLSPSLCFTARRRWRYRLALRWDVIILRLLLKKPLSSNN